MVEQPNSTKRSNLKRKEIDMGDMSWLSHLVTTGSREELEDFLQGKGFRKPKYAAEQFLKAQEEIERDGMKKAEQEYKEKHHTLDLNPEQFPNKDPEEYANETDGEPTTADKHNKEWLNEKEAKS